MARRRFTIEQIQEASDTCTGFCTACGAEKDGVEPDAQNYFCEECGEWEVFGALELLVMGLWI